MSYYDVDPPDPGTAGNGKVQPMVFRCTECPWFVSERWAVHAVAKAREHYQTTGHDIAHKGVVQPWLGEASR